MHVTPSPFGTELAFAENVTGSNTVTVSNGVAVDVLNLVLVVPASIRPVWLEMAITVSSSVASSQASIKFTEVSNGVDTAVNRLRTIHMLSNTTGLQSIEWRTRIGPTLRTRTWKVQIQSNHATAILTAWSPDHSTTFWDQHALAFSR